jgi:hypothetical protein
MTDIGPRTIARWFLRLRTWIGPRLCGSDHERELAQQRHQRLTSLREEIRENQAVASHPFLAGRVPRRFQLRAWDAAKADLEAYEPYHRDMLRAVYGKLRACNAHVDDFEQRKDGREIDIFEGLVNQLRAALEDVHEMLRNVRLSD